MQLERFRAFHYRSLRDVTVELHALNVFIGANASGKSNILDALRFLSAAIRDKDFEEPVRQRGGMLQIAWKGESAGLVRLTAEFKSDEQLFIWNVTIQVRGGAFSIDEDVHIIAPGEAPQQVLHADDGLGWWWSASLTDRRLVDLKLGSAECALAAASVDASFPARGVAEFVGAWGFFDPSPAVLRLPSRPDDSRGLDQFGRNLAGRLLALKESSPKTFNAIVDATRNVLGVPATIEPREGADGRVYFVQTEPGLNYTVHQLSASSGTLRMLAFMTGLLGEGEAALVGIEEPENYVHPSALDAFAEYIKHASATKQVLVTTHSPIFVDSIEDPGSIVIVRRTEQGTVVQREDSPERLVKALAESGLALGELHQTKGFGA